MLATFLELVHAGRIARGSYLIVESLDRLTREHIRPALTLLLNLIDNGIRKSSSFCQSVPSMMKPSSR